ncbi:MAG: sigma-70 family RNA polymerase sigma factor [Bacteroidales bacterium]|nr:sigma-70 family RNA polymerase sigma factor [Bacteroidales bacterium]MDD4670740.1 sigma-70 family RNA polymerase sigma factor [Bacteroidales bacterium]
MKNEDLWKKLKKGDVKALGVIYDRYADMLYSYGMKMTENPELVKDCIQDLFVCLYEKRDQIATPKDIQSYLLVSLKRDICLKVSDLIKKNRMNTDIDEIKYFRIRIDMQTTIDETWIEEEQLKVLQDAINMLSPQQQEVIYLRYYKDMSVREVSEIAEIKIQTVKNVAVTAMRKLRTNKTLIELFSSDGCVLMGNG